MFVRKTSGPRVVHLPDGRVLSLADLPPLDVRWVASRKATVVDAVNHGLLSREQAIDRYGLSDEEFDSWMDAVARHGKNGLKVTCLQRIRQPRGDGHNPSSPATGY